MFYQEISPPLLQLPVLISSVLIQPPWRVSRLLCSCSRPSPRTNTTGSKCVVWPHSILNTKHYFSSPFLPQKPLQNLLASNKTVICSRLCSLSQTQLDILLVSLGVIHATEDVWRLIWDWPPKKVSLMCLNLQWRGWNSWAQLGSPALVVSQQGSWTFLHDGSGLHKGESRSTQASESLCVAWTATAPLCPSAECWHLLGIKGRGNVLHLLAVTKNAWPIFNTPWVPPEEQQDWRHLNRDDRNQRPV